MQRGLLGKEGGIKGLRLSPRDTGVGRFLFVRRPYDLQGLLIQVKRSSYQFVNRLFEIT